MVQENTGHQLLAYTHSHTRETTKNIHVFSHTQSHIPLHTHMHALSLTHTQSQISLHTLVCTLTHIPPHTLTCMHSRTHTLMTVFTHTHTATHTCMHSHTLTCTKIRKQTGAVKSCSRGPEPHLQHPHAGPQPSVTPDALNPMSFSDPLGYLHTQTKSKSFKSFLRQKSAGWW